MCVNKKLSNSIYLCNNLTYNLQNVLYSKKFSLHFKSFCRIKKQPSKRLFNICYYPLALMYPYSFLQIPAASNIEEITKIGSYDDSPSNFLKHSFAT